MGAPIFFQSHGHDISIFLRNRDIINKGRKITNMIMNIIVILIYLFYFVVLQGFLVCSCAYHFLNRRKHLFLKVILPSLLSIHHTFSQQVYSCTESLRPAVSWILIQCLCSCNCLLDMSYQHLCIVCRFMVRAHLLTQSYL